MGVDFDQRVKVGQKIKLNACAEGLMIWKINRNLQISTRTLSRDLKEEYGVVLSYETVPQTLLKNKYSKSVTRNKQFIIS